MPLRGARESERYGWPMTSALADVKREWRRFKADPPGHRFQNQHVRMHDGSRKLLVLQIVVGLLLLACGVVLLFVPGPGLVLIVFGLALVAGLSNRLARLCDRAEPSLRERGHRVHAWWKRAPFALKLGIGALAAAGVAAFGYATYLLWFA